MILEQEPLVSSSDSTMCQMNKPQAACGEKKISASPPLWSERRQHLSCVVCTYSHTWLPSGNPAVIHKISKFLLVHNCFMISVVLKCLWYDFFNHYSAVGLAGILDIFSLPSGIWVIFLIFCSFSVIYVCFWMALILRKENIYWPIKWLRLEMKKVFLISP